MAKAPWSDNTEILHFSFFGQGSHLPFEESNKEIATLALRKVLPTVLGLLVSLQHPQAPGWDSQLFIYLAAPGLSCSMWIYFRDQGSNLGPLHREPRLLATGPPGKSQDSNSRVSDTSNSRLWDPAWAAGPQTG